MSALRSDELLPALNTDVLIIILEHLLHLYLNRRVQTWYKGFLDLRVLSKQMNELVLRIGYRRIFLGTGLLDSFKTYLKVRYEMPMNDSWQTPTLQKIEDQLKVAEHIRTYTQHIEINDKNYNLDWSWLPEMLRHMENLRQITYAISVHT